MPCYSEPSYSYYDREQSKLENKLARVESLLCSACRSLDASGFDFSMNPLLDEWWANHIKEDNQRMLEEMKAKQLKDHCEKLLKKPYGELTPEDKDNLRKLNLL